MLAFSVCEDHTDMAARRFGVVYDGRASVTVLFELLVLALILRKTRQDVRVLASVGRGRSPLVLFFHGGKSFTFRTYRCATHATSSGSIYWWYVVLFFVCCFLLTSRHSLLTCGTVIVSVCDFAQFTIRSY